MPEILVDNKLDKPLDRDFFFNILNTLYPYSITNAVTNAERNR